MNTVQQIGKLVGQVITRLHRIVETHREDYGNPHRVTKEQVGLGRVDNTPDEEKPLSEVQREALGNLSTSISAHVSDEVIHRTSEQIRADITDADIPPGIARKSEVESALLVKVSREEGKELMPSPPDEPDGKKYLCDDGTWKEINPDSLIFTAIPELPVDGSKGMQGDLNATFTILDDGAKEECWRRWMNGQRNIEGYLRYPLTEIQYKEDGSVDFNGGMFTYMKLTSCMTEWDMYPKFTAEYYWPYDGLDDFGTFANVGMFRAIFYFFVSGSGGEVHTGGHSIMSSALADLHWIYSKIESKVEKEAGKGLSSNDYTDADKARLGQVGSIADGLVVGGEVLDATGTPSPTWHIGKPSGVIAKNSGGVLEVRNAADNAYAGMVVDSLTVKGNMVVEGESFVVNSQTVETADNLILLNRGEVGAGVTKGVAGLEIDRGSADNYKIIFDESDDRFKAGAGADLWPILLRDREADLTDGNVLVWDAAAKRARSGKYLPLSGGAMKGSIELEGFGNDSNIILKDDGTVRAFGLLRDKNDVLKPIIRYYDGVVELGTETCLKVSNGPFFRRTSEHDYVIWDKGYQGSGSGLDADLLDGRHGSEYALKTDLSSGGGSADRLATPRTIWGQAFDGTANVSGNMTGVGSISASGNIVTSGEVTAYSASDRRLKENVRELDGLGCINRLHPVEFDWNDRARELAGDDRRHGYGLIAQEVKEVLPDLVSTIYDSDYLGVNYEKLIPFLIASVKQLSEEVKMLKNRE